MLFGPGNGSLTLTHLVVKLTFTSLTLVFGFLDMLVFVLELCTILFHVNYDENFQAEAMLSFFTKFYVPYLEPPVGFF